MKTKPITLILTLLFCLSGSVFAEEKKQNEYKPFRDLISLEGKLMKSVRNLLEINLSLYKKFKKNKSDLKLKRDSEILDYMHNQFNSLLSETAKFALCMEYEEVIVIRKINNFNLSARHNFLRSSLIRTFPKHLNNAKKVAKEERIGLQNTAAVVALNDTLKIIDDLESWFNRNKDFRLKLPDYPNVKK